jgi:hypothetical protein
MWYRYIPLIYFPKIWKKNLMIGWSVEPLDELAHILKLSFAPLLFGRGCSMIHENLDGTTTWKGRDETKMKHQIKEIVKEPIYGSRNPRRRHRPSARPPVALGLGGVADHGPLPAVGFSFLLGLFFSVFFTMMRRRLHLEVIIWFSPSYVSSLM